MQLASQCRLLSLTILLLALSMPYSYAVLNYENEIKTAVFLSPKFVLGPGSVVNKYFFNVEFPRGHIAIKSFNGEVVDEAGNPVPLYETYLHHWAVGRYHQHKNARYGEYDGHQMLHQSDRIVRNSGLCQGDVNGQYFGIGSETRRTDTHIPDPYGIEVGNPEEIPSGFEEKWLLNVHAIDTRGVEDKLGCTECWRDLYNVTKDENGQLLRPEYKGGLKCCYDGTQCRKREGYEGPRRGLYLRYTVKWMDWDKTVVPVKIYIIDVTDKWKKSSGSSGESSKHDCQIEYDVEPCSAAGMDGHGSGCIDVKRTSALLPSGGYVIYGVAHQHSGSVGSTLYGEDGRVICTSVPIYGEGTEAGNEAGYVVGMSTCYPQPGSVKINDGEVLTLEANYSSTKIHYRSYVTLLPLGSRRITTTF
ncbi:Stress up-regulated Nod 19 [Quillaja saponaria]|uniref:Stress up-regulated Nod 19 n=1 Tax=Quillaja saponaria TaxID=32244 RepID=A0AAD7LG36_QUISA|nr:Stress up-regulated Nod 19 [Quillaja saponaria]KAJ7957152.1 Stress up-regulated Nod 19 [Quillaja saponaria]